MLIGRTRINLPEGIIEQLPRYVKANDSPRGLEEKPSAQPPYVFSQACDALFRFARCSCVSPW